MANEMCKKWPNIVILGSSNGENDPMIPTANALAKNCQKCQKWPETKKMG